MPLNWSGFEFYATLKYLSVWCPWMCQALMVLYHLVFMNVAPEGITNIIWFQDLVWFVILINHVNKWEGSTSLLHRFQKQPIKRYTIIFKEMIACPSDIIIKNRSTRNLLSSLDVFPWLGVWGHRIFDDAWILSSDHSD